MRKSLGVLFLLLFAFTPSVYAHTGLNNSSPSNGETITEDIEEISLNFLTEIENGSSFSLVTEDDIEIPVQDIQVNGDKLTGKTDGPLENGNYSVEWNIIGEDGHLINGDFVFTVAKEETTEEIIEPTEDLEEDITEAPAVEKSEENAEQSTTASDVNEESEKNSNFLPLFVGILPFIALILIIWLIRKRKK